MPLTHQIVTQSSDTGYYTGKPYHFYMDKGQERGGTGATIYQQAQDALWFAKSILKTAGWQVAAWGSGSTTGVYSDPFSSSLSMTSDHGWFMLKHPISSRSFVIQKCASASNPNEGSIANYHNTDARIKYSPGGFAITGTLSAKNAPGPITESDQLIVLGGGTDALPTYAQNIPTITEGSINGTTAIWHCIAQTTGNYGFMLLGQFGSNVVSVLGLDPVLTPNPGDTEPYVVWSDFRSANFPMDNIGNLSPITSTAAGVNSFNKWTWVRRGFADQRSGAMCGGLSYKSFNQDMIAATTHIGKPPTKTAVFLPLMYACTQSNIATSSYKGISTMLKVASPAIAPYLPTQTTFSVFSLHDTALVGKGTVLPWFGVKYDAY
jgi:hypothetical protein